MNTFENHGKSLKNHGTTFENHRKSLKNHENAFEKQTIEKPLKTIENL